MRQSGIVVSLVAAFVTADAVTNFVGAAFTSLLNDFRVSNVSVAPSDEVSALFQVLFSQVGSAQTAYCYDGQANLFLDVEGTFGVKCVGDTQVGAFPQTDVGLEVTDGNVNNVNAQFLSFVQEVNNVVQSQTVEVTLLVVQFVVACGYADEQRHIFAHVFANSLNNCQRQLAAVFYGAAPTVVAVVEVGRQELVQDVVVAVVDFDCVEASFGCTTCSLAEAVNDVGDFFGFNTSAGDAEQSVGAHHTNLGGVVVRVGQSFCGVVDLDTDLAACSVNGVSQLLQTFDVVVIGDVQSEVLSNAGVYGAAFGEYKAAVLCTFGQVVDNTIVNVAVLRCHQGTHCGHDQTGIKFQASNLNGSKQFFVCHG